MRLDESRIDKLTNTDWQSSSHYDNSNNETALKFPKQDTSNIDSFLITPKSSNIKISTNTVYENED